MFLLMIGLGLALQTSAPSQSIVVCPGHRHCPRGGNGADPTAGPDPNLTPNYGSVNMNSGFLPDPRIIRVQPRALAGEALGDNCPGLVPGAPAVRLNYSAGTLPLILSVDSPDDTTLVVNAPDGRFYCDADSGEGHNPSLRFGTPQTGRYEIWVGVRAGTEATEARLHISELYSR